MGSPIPILIFQFGILVFLILIPIILI
jgi:hypothetical protein